MAIMPDDIAKDHHLYNETNVVEDQVPLSIALGGEEDGISPLQLISVYDEAENFNPSSYKTMSRQP